MDNKKTEKKAGRPTQAIRRQRVNLTLHPSVIGEASKAAFDTNRSLSGLVEHSLKLAIRQMKEEPDSAA